MASEDNGAHKLIEGALDRLHDDIVDARKDVQSLRDLINGYHGDTVSTASCNQCQSRWVDRRFFTVAMAIATPAIGLITWLIGLVAR